MEGLERKKCYPYLDDLVAGELQCWDMHGIASHQVSIQNAKNRFMGDNEEVILLSFKLENDGLKTDCEVVV